jgi:hypothetical protein
VAKDGVGKMLHRSAKSRLDGYQFFRGVLPRQQKRNDPAATIELSAGARESTVQFGGSLAGKLSSRLKYYGR